MPSLMIVRPPFLQCVTFLVIERTHKLSSLCRAIRHRSDIPLDQDREAAAQVRRYSAVDLMLFIVGRSRRAHVVCESDRMPDEAEQHGYGQDPVGRGCGQGPCEASASDPLGGHPTFGSVRVRDTEVQLRRVSLTLGVDMPACG